VVTATPGDWDDSLLCVYIVQTLFIQCMFSGPVVQFARVFFFDTSRADKLNYFVYTLERSKIKSSMHKVHE
jgi:hypothetical protein